MRTTTASVFALCTLLGASACATTGHSRQPEGMARATTKDNLDHSVQEVSANDAMGREDPNHSALADAHGVGAFQPVQPGDKTAPAPASASMATTTPGSCLNEVYFPTDSAKLGQNEQQSLNHMADCMKRHEIDHATIVGQTDPSGNKQHNDQLGMERARVVADYLRTRGVPDNQIKVSSKGEMNAAQDRQLWPTERKTGVQATP